MSPKSVFGPVAVASAVAGSAHDRGTEKHEMRCAGTRLALEVRRSADALFSAGSDSPVSMDC